MLVRFRSPQVAPTKHEPVPLLLLFLLLLLPSDFFALCFVCFFTNTNRKRATHAEEPIDDRRGWRARNQVSTERAART